MIDSLKPKINSLDLIVCLALLQTYPVGTKLNLTTPISFSESSYYESFYRWYNGEKRSDINYFYGYLKHFVKWNSKASVCGRLMKHAAVGIRMLSKTYEASEITHSLSQCYEFLYSDPKSPLMNPKSRYSSKDIEKVVSMLDQCCCEKKNQEEIVALREQILCFLHEMISRER